MTTMTRKFDISNPFGAVWGASGVQGFFGEGYPFHSILKRFCPGFLLRISFVAKTATLDSRPGNMPLSGITPTERLPKCVWASHRKGIALNAVGLSNPGLEALLLGKFKGVPQTWQERDKPFQISIMSTAQTSEARLRETKDMLGLIGRCATDFQSEFGIQINISCPNVTGGVDFGTNPQSAQAVVKAVRESCSLPVIAKLTPNVTDITVIARAAADGRELAIVLRGDGRPVRVPRHLTDRATRPECRAVRVRLPARVLPGIPGSGHRTARQG